MRHVSYAALIGLFILSLSACESGQAPEPPPTDGVQDGSGRPTATVDLTGFPQSAREQAAKLIDAVNAAPNDARSAGLAGMFAHAYERPDIASRYYARATELAPDEFQWPYLNGVLLTEAGRDSEALAAFAAASTINADYPPLRLRQAQLQLKLGDAEQAMGLLEALVGARPGYAEAQFALGQAHINSGRHADAIAPLKAAVERVPHYGAAHYALATAYDKTGDSTLAGVHRDLFEKNQRGAPANPDRVLTRVQDMRNSSRQAVIRAGRLSAAGRFAEAAEVFEALLRKEPDNAVAHINLIGLYGELGDIGKARDIYERGASVVPQAARLHSNYGVLLMRNGDDAGAIAAFDKAIDIDAELASAYKFRGMAYQRTGDNQAALASLARAYELDPLDDQAGYALGTAQIAARQFEAAAETLTATLEPVSAKTPTYLRALAQARLSAGNPQGAGDALRRARELASDYGQAATVEDIDEELAQLAEAGVATP